MQSPNNRGGSGSSELLSRKELQAYLKQHGLRAVGTTAAMRILYDEAQQRTVADDIGSVSPAAAAAAARPAARPAKKEKRLQSYRSTCSMQTQARIDRAKTQRLYLIQRGEVDVENLECEFVVLGSTGNVYTVRIARRPSCSCPDFIHTQRRNKYTLCKHILFVMLKVIGVDSTSPLVYQAALIGSELEDLFALLSRRRVGGTTSSSASSVIVANERVRSTFQTLASGHGDDTAASDSFSTSTSTGVKRKVLQEGDSDCPICFDAMTTTKMNSITLTYCRAMCGMNFHSDCIRRWLHQQTTTPTCPNCREPWQNNETCATATITASLRSAASNSPEGYTNLGQLQGQPTERDTSTYAARSPYSRSYKRRRC